MKPIDPFLAALVDWTGVFMRRSMRNLLLYSKETGLSMSQLGALFRLYRGASGVSDIGDGLGVTSAAASQMLDRLEQLGLIQRTEDPKDRRGKQIHLTDKGRRILQTSLRDRQKWLDDLANHLTEQEKGQATAALHIMTRKALELEQTSTPEA